MPASSWPEIGTWMIGLLGALGALVLVLNAVRLVRALFEKNPPVETFVKALDEKQSEFEDKLTEQSKELKLDGSIRSKTLFNHIKEELRPVNETLRQHGERIARLEERHPPHRHHERPQ